MAKIKLSKPIIHGEETINELSFRTPKSTEVIEFGYPIIAHVNEEGASMEFKMKIIMKYASRLSGYPPSSFDDIELSDLMAIANEIANFFNEAASKMTQMELSQMTVTKPPK